MYIWTLELGAEDKLASEMLAACGALLSEDEKLMAERFMFDKDRNRYILAHALSRLMLSFFGKEKPENWMFDREEKGRPFIKPEMNAENLDFNISHTPGMVGCAVSKRGRIGFDLEPKDRKANLEALAAKQFALLEQQQFSAAPEAEKARKFFEFWTLKESYIKLTGKGLSENLSGFSFDLSGNKPNCYVGDKHLVDYEFGLFDVADKHQGAWAYQSRNDKTQSPSIKPEYRHFTLESFWLIKSKSVKAEVQSPG